MMNEFAELEQFEKPVIELFLEPYLYRISDILESCRKTITHHLSGNDPLPCILTVPDMLDFIAGYLDSNSSGAEKIAAELAAALASKLDCALFKLSFS